MALPAALTLVLVPLQGVLNLVSDVLLFLLATVVVALVGGMLPALVSAVVCSVSSGFAGGFAQVTCSAAGFSGRFAV